MKLLELCLTCELVCDKSGEPDLQCIETNDDKIPEEELPKLMAEAVIFQADELMKGLNEG